MQPVGPACDPHVDLVAPPTEGGLTHLDLLLMEGMTQRGPPVRPPTLHGDHGAKIAIGASGHFWARADTTFCRINKLSPDARRGVSKLGCCLNITEAGAVRGRGRH
jgi:hypothetical protein